MKLDTDRRPAYQEFPHPFVKGKGAMLPVSDSEISTALVNRFRCPVMQCWLTSDATCQARKAWLAFRGRVIDGKKTRRQVSPNGYGERERLKEFELCLTCKKEEV